MMLDMGRTTVTLTDESELIVRRLMNERGLTFKAAINAAITEGAPPASRPKPFVQRTRKMGMRIPLDRATTLAGELEDIELIRKRDMGK